MTPTTAPAPSDESHLHPIYAQEGIDLRGLAKALLRYRWWVLAFAIGGTLAGLGLSLASTAYVSQGLFLTPGVKVDAYKTYEAALNNEPRMEEYLQVAKVERDTASLLRRLVQVSGAMTKAVRPIFALTSKEAKSYDIQPGSSSDLVGFELTLERGSKTGAAPVVALAEYVRHTLIQTDLKDALLNFCLSYQSRAQELRNEQIKSNFSVTQLESKAATLRRLIAESPGTASIDSRQVVSLKNGGDRYLSPTAQLVAAEVGIADLKLADTQRERDRVASALKEDYYCRARAAQEQPVTGKMLLVDLESIRGDVLQDQDMGRGIVEQTANELDLERKGWVNLYVSQMRFVASPDAAEKKLRRPKLAMAIGLGAFVGMLLGMTAALFLAWWHDNRNEIVAEDGP